MEKSRLRTFPGARLSEQLKDVVVDDVGRAEALEAQRELLRSEKIHLFLS